MGDITTFVIGQIGTVSFRLFGDNSIELSRLFINTDYRGQGMGRKIVNLTQQIIGKNEHTFNVFTLSPIKLKLKIQGME